MINIISRSYEKDAPEIFEKSNKTLCKAIQVVNKNNFPDVKLNIVEKFKLPKLIYKFNTCCSVIWCPTLL